MKMLKAVDPIVNAVVIDHETITGYTLSMFFSGSHKGGCDIELQHDNIVRKASGEKCHTCISCTDTRCFFAFKKYPECYLEK